jgi:hypothetical protein
VTITGPGPGEVWQFAQEVRKDPPKAKKWQGVLAAIDWVFGENGNYKHPYLKESVQKSPPNMAAITQMVREVEKVRKESSGDSEFYNGMKEFLSWIVGASDKPSLPGAFGYAGALG